MEPTAAGVGRAELLRRADALIDLKRFGPALETLAPLLADSTDGAALARAARALLGLDRHPEAVEMARRAAAASPESEWPHRLRSAALMELAKKASGDERFRLFAEAREAARTAVRLAPTVSVTYRHAVTAEINAGDLDSAGLALQRLFQLAPDEGATWNTGSLVALAQDDPLLAERYARRAIELSPNSPEAWNNLGVALVRNGRMKDAVSAYVQSARLDPSESLTRGNIARSGLMVVRTIVLVCLLPVLLVPDGVAIYIGAVVAGYYLCRPGGWQRARAESLGIHTALRMDRMSLRSETAQRFLAEVVPRLVGVGVVFACLAASENTSPAVNLICLAAAVACLVHRAAAVQTWRGHRR